MLLSPSREALGSAPVADTLGPIAARGRTACALALALAAALAAIGAAFAASEHAAGAPRCFGAASLDRVHPCQNPKLRRMVVPSPEDALLMADGRPCVRVEAPFRACAFGAPPERATRVVALLGDSHAEHWRTPLYLVAQRLRWSVVLVTRGSCFFTTAVQDAPPAKRDGCVEWNRAVVDWFARHPEISAVVTSAHPGPVYRRPGETMVSAWARGYLAAWDELPPTVRQILVIRDVPFIDPGTLPCVEQAMARRLDAGRLCAVPRIRAVHHDAEVVAAKHVRNRQAQVIDMTDFFCGARRCFPVIGGALVFKDFYTHLTTVYGRTLGPYLLRKVVRATASWGSPGRARALPRTGVRDG